MDAFVPISITDGVADPSWDPQAKVMSRSSTNVKERKAISNQETPK